MDLERLKADAESFPARAQLGIGLGFFRGVPEKGIPQDYEEAVKWFRKAALQGEAHAQYWLGRSYITALGINYDVAEAVKWMQKAADQNDADAQLMMGELYRTGGGVPQDYAEMEKWYSKAAAQGHEKAIKMMDILKNGRG